MLLHKKKINTITVNRFYTREQVAQHYGLDDKQALEYKEKDNLIEVIIAFVYDFAATFEGHLHIGRIKIDLRKKLDGEKLNVDRRIKALIKSEVVEAFMSYSMESLLRRDNCLG